MALYGQGFSLRSLLENPILQNPPNLNKGSADQKKSGKFGGYLPNVNSAFLGSNLWDKPSNDNSSSNEFDLEYMDLDEFLSENGIPVNPADTDDSQTISLLASALARSPSRSPNPGSPGLLIEPVSPANPLSIQVGNDLDKLEGFSNMSSPVGPPSSPLSQVVSPRSVTSNVEGPSHSVIERYLMDDNFGVKLPLPKADKMPDGKESGRKRKLSGTEYKVTPDDIPVVTIPVYQQKDSPIQYRQMEPSPCWDSNDDDSNDGEEFINNIIPGQDGFDPTARKFTTEELKPQPIIKKARKIFVDDGSKDDKYWQRRKKNNVAAKRSREARRVKENQIAMRASFLESENDKLRVSYEKLQRENESLMKRLSKYE